MVTVRNGIRAEEVNFGVQHVLFVEGSENSFDRKTLSQLLDSDMKIEPLGPSHSLTHVAKSLFKFHPTYYFLIDRDHHDNDYVDRCWNDFPDPATYNLLIWRRKEIENYFLDPSYLFQSKYCEVSEDEIQNTILKYANDRFFFDVANNVIISIREELKQTWIDKFSDPSGFPTKDIALNKLKEANEFRDHCSNVNQKLSVEEIEYRFNNIVERMAGDKSQLVFGSGEWLDLIHGKKVLSQVINSGCFKVKNANGDNLQGKEKMNEIIKDLLQKDSSVLPQDFLTLKRLINTRITASN